MKILVACEFSGIVRDAFIKRGHEAISCDLLPSERPGPHIHGDVNFTVWTKCFDMVIAFPPCTYLCISGNRWIKGNPERWQRRVDALNFVNFLMQVETPKICIENPVGVISSHIRQPDQYVHPCEFGHPVRKKTGLWLKGLPCLKPTKIVEPALITTANGKQYSGPAYAGPSPDRAKDRSRTYQGIADAMADQWG